MPTRLSKPDEKMRIAKESESNDNVEGAPAHADNNVPSTVITDVKLQK